jgi:antitoxin component YwqK of YwqJK toxin-antitoxin module
MSWYENGSPAFQASWMHGTYSYSKISWYPNGNVKERTRYDKNCECYLKEDTSFYYYPSGAIMYKEIYSADIVKNRKQVAGRDYYTIYYYETGNIEYEGKTKFINSYKDEDWNTSSVDYCKDGVWKYYDVMGNLTHKDVYVNCTLVSK